MTDTAQMTKLIADTPEQIRGVDIYRLFDTYWESRNILKSYLVTVRPDLEDEINDAIVELS